MRYEFNICLSYYSCEEQTENSELEEKNRERNSENSRAIQKVNFL